MLKTIFIVSAILAAVSIVIGKIFVFGRQKPVFTGNYAAAVAAVIGVYSILAFAMLTQGGYFDKLAMLLFALSPYLIGRITTYRNINFFTMVQVIVLILSAFYAFYCID